MSTAQMYLVTATVDGKSLGVFDTFSGGETTAEVSKHRPGGMGAEKTYPSLGTTGDCTVTRVYERERDHELARQLRTRVGLALVTITEQPLDDFGVAWGKPTVYTGRLSGVNTGESDSQSSDPRILELTVSTSKAS